MRWRQQEEEVVNTRQPRQGGMAAGKVQCPMQVDVNRTEVAGQVPDLLCPPPPTAAEMSDVLPQ
jgi:hypothetical protein